MTTTAHRRYSVLAVGLLLSATLATGCSPFKSGGGDPRDGGVVSTQKGEASFYADAFHGRKTASGEHFDMHGMTAAHRKLPFGTRVRVTNLNNGRQVVVRINDRGPYAGGRVIDVSHAAARKLDMMGAGVVPVKVEVLKH
jgi:rare lipoprotein A